MQQAIFFTHNGGGSNYICLPDDPIYGTKSKSQVSEAGYVYSAEYETNFFAANSNDEDVPCAVCSTADPATMMIPGRNACYQGWTTQYKGYLASSSYIHVTQYNYICMDENVKFINGGAQNAYGAEFYSVIGKCRPLNCPPYREGEPLSCAVC